ncbi:clumping factor A isoform X2 [Aethina tumida]|uniref:clumping factor A isoform X2 n=1 Tax=Aethina tumida TaxID=116153 RepID=UPI002147B037|nr:clumping factor A isoform X2 [Aethina tumida]
MILVIHISVIVILVMSLIFCLCWKKKTPKGTITNTRRSLPDIPSDQNAVHWEPNGDNSSEHYATVGQYQNNAKRSLLSNGDARPSISQHSSMSQADDFSPYERVKYDKIKNKEHPYAQVQPNTSRLTLQEENQIGSEERLSLIRVDGPSTSNEPTAPPRSRRSSAHSGLGVDIPAASAVAGGIAASPDLPYMTPPVTQVNFSGDSQDSSKGYTSISVREPLANIMAQTKEMRKKQREQDPHYATVSDDSDEVYTTIPDPNNQIYTSESETYARIPALPVTTEVEINQAPTKDRGEEAEKNDELYEPAPQPTPPSVDSLKQVTGHSYTHSRQASSSSSVANIGSPKPEKRQANSPLPPPPIVSNFDPTIDKLPRNLDDLYAKVQKSKKDDTTSDRTPEKAAPDLSTRNSIGIVEEGKLERRRKEHNYETLKKSPRKISDPGYEKIRNEEPGYASINGPESITSSDPGYEVLKNRTVSESDPNYEELRHKISNASDCAGYSRIKEKPDAIDGYSVVNKRPKNSSNNSLQNRNDQHDYESMPNQMNSDPDYSTYRSNDSESDPNYESVNQNDPNYESVKDFEPPYERLDDDSSRTDSDVLAYEKIKKKGFDNNDTSESSNSGGKSLSDPPYEQLGNDTDSEVPGYEKIQNHGSGDGASNSSANESNYSTIKSLKEDKSSDNIHDEDAIFQV